MKYDCSDEFDLCEIYDKLVGASLPHQNVAANNFFAPALTLAAFQQALNNMMKCFYWPII